MKIKGVIFDWAGTTVDYGCFSPVGAFMDAFAKKGIEITIDEAREPMGKLKLDHTRAILAMPRVKESFQNKFNRESNDSDLKELYSFFEESLFSTLKDYIEINPYVLEVVSELRKKGIKIGTTTGYTKEMMEVILPIAKDKGYNPDFTIASDEVKEGRPSADMINANAKFFSIEDMKTLIKVGDTAVDMKEGKNAGALAVGVILGSSELGLTYKEVMDMDKKQLEIKKELVRKKLIEAGADYVIDDMRGLLEIIDAIENR